jgi:hypothetical protein
MKTLVVIAMLAGSLWAQDKPKADAPKPIAMSQASQNKILKAEHEYDTIIAGEQQLQIQYAQCTPERMQALQTNFTAIDAKKDPAAKAVSAAIEDAWKDSGLSKTEYDIDPANFSFTKKDTSKVATAAPTPSK